MPEEKESEFLKISELFVKYGVPQITIRRWVINLRKSDISVYQRVIKEDKTDTGFTLYISEEWFLDKMKRYKREAATPEIVETGMDNQPDISTNQVITENIKLKITLDLLEKENEKKDKTIEEKDNKINAICMEAGKWKGQYEQIKYLLAEVKNRNQEEERKEWKNLEDEQSEEGITKETNEKPNEKPNE